MRPKRLRTPDLELKFLFNLKKLIKDLYHKCNLVHADFNQFNLLWFENKVWVVDVSQSVEPIHPMGWEFLLRDCINVQKVIINQYE